MRKVTGTYPYIDFDSVHLVRSFIWYAPTEHKAGYMYVAHIYASALNQYGQ